MNLSPGILRKMGSLVVLLAGVAVVVAVGTLLAHFVFSTTPPDVSKADLSEIATFTKSEAFLKMNSKDRVDFSDALLARYLRMTPEERAKAKGMFSWLKLSKAAREAFWLDWARKRGEDFEQLSSDEQDAYVDRWLDTVEVLAGARSMRRTPNESPSARSVPSRSDVEIGQRMRQALTKTSAKDRQRVAKLGGAVIRRLRERREQ